MGSAKHLLVLFGAVLLVSPSNAVSLDDLSNAMDKMMEKVADLERQVLEQSNKVITCIHNRLA